MTWLSRQQTHVTTLCLCKQPLPKENCGTLRPLVDIKERSNKVCRCNAKLAGLSVRKWQIARVWEPMCCFKCDTAFLTVVLELNRLVIKKQSHKFFRDKPRSSGSDIRPERLTCTVRTHNLRPVNATTKYGGRRENKSFLCTVTKSKFEPKIRPQCEYPVGFIPLHFEGKHGRAHFPSHIPGVGLPLSPMMSSLKR